MSDNVTVREPEVTDRSNRQPAVQDDRAVDAAAARAEPVTTADVAAAASVDAARAMTTDAPRPDGDGASAPLFGDDQAAIYRSRWQEIQTGFVDEPRAAVQEADALVADVMRQLARTFADERRELEGEWAEGDEVSTEDLRIALRRYRSFFDRLLSV
jgi:hypothetical protein